MLLRIFGEPWVLLLSLCSHPSLSFILCRTITKRKFVLPLTLDAPNHASGIANDYALIFSSLLFQQDVRTTTEKNSRIIFPDEHQNSLGKKGMQPNAQERHYFLTKCKRKKFPKSKEKKIRLISLSRISPKLSFSKDTESVRSHHSRRHFRVFCIEPESFGI